MTLQFTRAAEDDLLEIFVTGILEFGEAQAKKYQEELKRSLDFIEDNPLGARERPELKSGVVRVHPSGVHVIIYRVQGEDVLVIRVRHAREDWISDSPGD
jgi:toxin ParE1/3/4